MLTLGGCAAALLLGLLAVWASRNRNYYAADVYGMTRASHLRFALACLVFAAAFAVSTAVPVLVVPLWGAFLTIGILYGASFVRGYGD
jgi:hypothetical protein